METFNDVSHIIHLRMNFHQSNILDQLLTLQQFDRSNQNIDYVNP